MKTILIVDDDKYISDMLSETLKRENYNVIRAFSGTECLLVLELLQLHKVNSSGVA